MQPQGTPPSAPNQYDFILNQAAHSKQPLMSNLSGRSQKQRVLIVIGGFVALLVIVLIAFKLFFGGSGSTSTLLKVAQSETEIARVAKFGEQSARSQSLQNNVATLQSVMASNSANLASTMKKEGLKAFSDKQITSTKNSKLDTQLTDAKNADHFDETFKSIMNTLLQTYINNLQAAYKDTSSSALRKTLNANYTSIENIADSFTTQ